MQIVWNYGALAQLNQGWAIFNWSGSDAAVAGFGCIVQATTSNLDSARATGDLDSRSLTDLDSSRTTQEVC